MAMLFLHVVFKTIVLSVSFSKKCNFFLSLKNNEVIDGKFPLPRTGKCQH